MRAFDYDVTAPIGHRATLGLVVLQSDETVEPEMHQMFAPDCDGTALYVTRIPSGAEVTREKLAQMAPMLTDTVSLLPPSLTFDAVGYGCTSGTSVIGADAVEAAVRAGTHVRAVTNPLTALVVACRALQVTRLGFLSPYIGEVSAGLRGILADEGIACAALGTFNEAQEARVARIDPASIRAAVLELMRDGTAEAVFMSCTNLRTLNIISDLEGELDVPVFSSNQVMGWHMARLSGAAAHIPGRLGRL